MNIWLINPFDELPGEGPEQRYGCLARCLTEAGHEVVWVSSGFRHRGKHAERAGVGIRDTGVGFKLVLVDAPAYKKNISVRRLWSQWIWGRRVEREMLKKVKAGELNKPDVILASSPPLEGAQAGMKLASRFGAKSIVDFQDDWPATWLQVVPRSSAEIGKLRNWGIRIGQGAGRLLLWPWFRMARWIYSNADAVSATSSSFAARAKELGFQGEVHVCYLGGARSALECGPDEGGTALNMEESGTSQAQDRTPGMLHILYLGGMGRVYDIDTVLRAAKLAQDAGLPWQWSLAGTDPEGKWQVQALAMGLSHLTFTGYVQAEVLQDLLASADLGLIPMNPHSGVEVPNKVGDYLGAGLAVVNSLPGELESLLAKGVSPCNCAFSPEEKISKENDTIHGLTPLAFAGVAGSFYLFKDPQSLFDTIKSYADDPQKLSDAKRAATSLFEQHFNREKTYPLFAEWVSALRGMADE